ncbi:uncharacterized PE-PGRS family protein PE_PGRS46 isoform X2 [Venturia canescens]|uniref:uncharacterized PE-PGRS family protein PE_PGRS46 isoform X2 n=1 Tax=Venturia canescens TaxID=32260 RepID=UPI001C9C4B2E|nr:uncharacterized PE-PGRS family protein PE_PGRS46 isoform X2 [Venturia canescens]
MSQSGRAVEEAGDDANRLPFLQFKNGGIRVNFAGYHAEAGLGGLLGGPDAKGGLFASAGTPWGPSASAGLGGGLGGADGTATGGLHARAGLGNGGPEAAAGLGGSLDGSGRSGSRARGGLYAGASPGGPPVLAGLDGNIDQNGRSTGSSYASNGYKAKVAVKGSNIQSIAPPKEKNYLAKSETSGPSTSLEFGLPANNRAGPSSLAGEDVGHSGLKDAKPASNDAVTAAEVQDVVGIPFPARRYYRKLLRGNPARKNVFYKYFTTNDVPTEVASSYQPVGIVERQSVDNQTHTSVEPEHSHVPYAPAPYGPAPHAPAPYLPYGGPVRLRGPTIFDDIFNIPISTLAAVNQLLNNKAG